MKSSLSETYHWHFIYWTFRGNAIQRAQSFACKYIAILFMPEELFCGKSLQKVSSLLALIFHVSEPGEKFKLERNSQFSEIEKEMSYQRWIPKPHCLEDNL